VCAYFEAFEIAKLLLLLFVEFEKFFQKICIVAINSLAILL
jgi:hypothetical protein